MDSFDEHVFQLNKKALGNKMCSHEENVSEYDEVKSDVRVDGMGNVNDFNKIADFFVEPPVNPRIEGLPQCDVGP